MQYASRSESIETKVGPIRSRVERRLLAMDWRHESRQIWPPFVGGRYYSAHRIAYELAIGPIPRGMKVLHLCNASACVNSDHLLLGTNVDRVAKARMAKGQRNGASKLTPKQVLAIRAARGTQREIAAKFSVSHQNVGRILRRQIWTHV